jgi:superfamily I DNA and RNA helicase
MRITRKLDSLLRRDAKTKGVSVNALLAQILTKYAEWDRNAEKFGFTSLTEQVFRGILASTDEESLLRTAKELGSRVPKEFILFWFKRIGFDTFVNYVTVTCKYGGIGACETDSEGKYVMMTIQHDYGDKWSRFTRYFLEEGIRSCLGIDNAQFDISKNAVFIRLPAH